LTTPDEWVALSDLVATDGREDYLAERITTERKARGWSQERLAKELSRVGCHMPQSSISKIENPSASARRGITVDEAIAFSRLFEVPLVELVLPPDAGVAVRAYQLLAEGRQLRNQLTLTELRYYRVVEEAADSGSASGGQWRMRLESMLEREIDDIQERGYSPDASPNVQLLRDVIARMDAMK
jgi:transcriptional regulator with XRE-family HTH domain